MAIVFLFMAGILLSGAIVSAEERTVSDGQDNLSIPWETYINEQYGYSLEYPHGWRMLQAKPRTGNKEEQESGILVENELQKVTFLEKDHKLWQGEFQVRVFENPARISLDEWMKRNEPRDITGGSLVQGKSDELLNGEPAVRLSALGFDHEQIEIVSLYRGLVYRISFAGRNPNDDELKEHRKIYERMRLSFRFLP